MTTRLRESSHPSDSDLVRYLDSEGGTEQRKYARDHLDECPRCQQRLRLLRARSAALSDLIGQMQVPEREIAAPPVGAGMTATYPHGSSPGARSAGVLKAAAIMVLMAVPAVAMVPPVRAWIMTQWSEFTASPAALGDSVPALPTPAGSSVSFVPSGKVLNVWLEREPEPGMIWVRPLEMERVTVETAASAGDRLFVLPNGVRIENGSDSNARYVITVPSTLDAVVVYAAGVEYMSMHPLETARELRRESQGQP